jgi:hypothetical protein
MPKAMVNGWKLIHNAQKVYSQSHRKMEAVVFEKKNLKATATLLIAGFLVLFAKSTV